MKKLRMEKTLKAAAKKAAARLEHSSRQTFRDWSLNVWAERIAAHYGEWEPPSREAYLADCAAHAAEQDELRERQEAAIAALKALQEQE